MDLWRCLPAFVPLESDLADLWREPDESIGLFWLELDSPTLSFEG
jgi:hypothetical protein